MIRLAWPEPMHAQTRRVQFQTGSPFVSSDDPILDRRAQRTRMALRDALIELLGERDWDDVAVLDICERANVGRSTFYLHYAGKEALLEGGLEDLRHYLQSSVQASGAGQRNNWAGFMFTRGLAEHVQENRAIFKRLIGRRGGFAVHQRFHDMLVKLIESELPEADGPLPREAQGKCIAALFTELMGWWFDTGSKATVDQMTVLLDESAAALLGKVADAG